MKKPSPKRVTGKKPRVIYLFQPLELGKEDRKSTDFFDSYMAVEQRHLVLEEEGFKARRREQKKKLALYQKGFAAIQDAIRNRNPKAIESVKADKDLYEVVCEIITKLDAKLEGTQAENKPEKAPKIEVDSKERASATSNLKQEARMLKMRQLSDETMNDLLSLMEKDDAFAAKTLVEIIEPLCSLLHIMVRRKPELFRPIARKAFVWPALVRQRANWVKETKEILTNIEFGEETFFARFRKDLVFDANHPARSYAAALVQNIEFNRYYLATISSRMPAIQSLIEEGYDFEEMPSWSLEAAKLSVFSAEGVKAWMAVAKIILRQQVPDFHLRPEWTSVASRFEPHEKGRIQNKILDQIGSAMKTISKP